MKKLEMNSIVTIAAACIAMTASAMTYEQGKAFLAGKTMDNMNTGNVQLFLEAQVAVTNGYWINTALKKKLITAAEACEWYNRMPSRYMDQTYAVNMSSNETVRTTFVDKLCSDLKTSTDLHYQYAVAETLKYMRNLATSENEALSIMKKAVATGKLGFLGMLLYSGRIVNGTASMNRSFLFTTNYVSYIDSKFNDVSVAWLELQIDPTLHSQMSNGADIMLRKVYVFKKDLTSADVNKIKQLNLAYAGKKPAVLACCKSSMKAGKSWAIELNNHVLSTRGFLDTDYRNAAICYRYAYKSNDGFKRSYNFLKSDNMKIAFAIWLNDADKVIDILKSCSSKIDASLLNKAIIVMNGIDVDYRTDDQKLALMNVNKKYTLKLYDDRDTWEPILSKVRAMIDVL